MSTSNAANRESKPSRNVPRRKPITFAEWFVVLNGVAPLVLLMIDAQKHQLGGDPIRNALHTTGSLALGILVLTLMITPLIRLMNWRGLAEYRRPLGLIAFFYALAHVSIYVGYDQGWKWQTAWEEICQRRYLQIGGVALLLLLPLAITSSTWWVDRLGFRRWKRLHRLIYPAAILAVAHYWLQSKADLWWQIGFAAAVGGLLLFRLVDARRTKTETQKIAEDKIAEGEITKDVDSSRVTIEAEDHVSVFDCEPGETILAAAERSGVRIPSMCQAGQCGTCRVQLLSGKVKMDSEEGLSEEQQARGDILACQAICASPELSVKID